MQNVCCIRCGKSSAACDITVDIDAPTIRCSGCDEEYTIADVEKVVAGWAAVLPWLKSHPALGGKS